MIFFLDFVFAVEVIALLGGAFLLLRVEKEATPSAALLKWIAYFAMAVAVGAMVCTVYYGFKYRNAGHFERPHHMMDAKHGMDE